MFFNCLFCFVFVIILRQVFLPSPLRHLLPRMKKLYLMVEPEIGVFKRIQTVNVAKSWVPSPPPRVTEWPRVTLSPISYLESSLTKRATGESSVTGSILIGLKNKNNESDRKSNIKDSIETRVCQLGIRSSSGSLISSDFQWVSRSPIAGQPTVISHETQTVRRYLWRNVWTFLQLGTTLLHIKISLIALTHSDPYLIVIPTRRWRENCNSRETSLKGAT